MIFFVVLIVIILICLTVILAVYNVQLNVRFNTFIIPALFYAAKFLGSRFMNFDRTRNYVAFQIAVFLLLVFAVAIADKGKIVLSDGILTKYFFPLMLVVAFGCTVGITNGHEIFQIMIDSYKYIEIVVFYFLFRISWTDTEKLMKGLESLYYEMMVFGVIELFVTSRGGVGLNLIVCLFPMVLLLIMRGYFNYYVPALLISFVVIAMCQTRTYIIGYLVGMVILCIMSYKKEKKRLGQTLIIFGIVVALITVLFNLDLFSSTISRFLELSEGFDEAGGYRLDEYKVAIQKFLSAPILGRGFGYLEYLYIDKMGWIYWGDFIHDIYLEIFMKLGLIGGISVVAMTASLLKKMKCAYYYYKDKDEMISAIITGGIISCVSWLFIYALAPLSTYGTIFIGIIIACIAIDNYEKEAAALIQEAE